MSFAHPYVLLFLPVVILLPWLRRRIALNFSSIRLVSMQPTLRSRLSWVPDLLASLAGMCLVFALARPQYVEEENINHKEGIDIMLVVDTSGSMEQEDYELKGRSVSRMNVSKAVLSEFVQSRPNDRIGMVVFGEEAFTQIPLTLDHAGMVPFMEQVSIGMAGPQSTSIGSGIAIAVKRLKDLEAPSKVIIMLTDGQSNSGIDPLEAAKAASGFGIKIYTIGIGGEARGFFGLFAPRVDLDEQSLQKIAELTGGSYFRASSTKTLRQVYDQIDKLEPTTAEFFTFTRSEEHYHALVWTGLFILLVRLILEKTWLRRLP